MATAITVRFVNGTESYNVALNGADVYTIETFIVQVNNNLNINAALSNLRINGSVPPSGRVLVSGDTIELVKTGGTSGC